MRGGTPPPAETAKCGTISHRPMYVTEVTDRYLELLDTAFIVMRKNFTQISFLHLYQRVLLMWAWYDMLASASTLLARPWLRFRALESQQAPPRSKQAPRGKACHHRIQPFPSFQVPGVPLRMRRRFVLRSHGPLLRTDLHLRVR